MGWRENSMTPKNSFSALAIALLFAGLSAQAATLTGAVHSADGKTMEGVAVSARASDQTITTTVYTQQDGRYSFPALADGQYAIWAQAEGFDAGIRLAESVPQDMVAIRLCSANLDTFHLGCI